MYTEPNQNNRTITSKSLDNWCGKHHLTTALCKLVGQFQNANVVLHDELKQQQSDSVGLFISGFSILHKLCKLITNLQKPVVHLHTLGELNNLFVQQNVAENIVKAPLHWWLHCHPRLLHSQRVQNLHQVNYKSWLHRINKHKQKK